MDMTAFDRRLLTAIEDGLPLDPRPYARIAEGLGVSEEKVIARLAALRQGGLIRRFGVIVRHHELGYCANAMTVWDVADDIVAETGRRIAAMPDVTLCYRRPRRLPAWPYNLFCMVHGRDRAAVEAAVERITRDAGLAEAPRAVLFSRRRFKQRGARYAAAEPSAPRRARMGA
jgi:DNA-binding Lrp family transcriptional regulator